MAHATVLYLGTEKGLWTLGSAGGSWRLIPRGLQDLAITSVMLHPTQLLTFYAAAEGDEAGLYRSESGGADWQRIIGGPITATALATDEAKRRRTRARDDEAEEAEEQPFALLAAIDCHIQRSDDGGNTWQRLAMLTQLAGMDEDITAILAQDRSNIYAGYADGRLFSSDDGGVIWRQCSHLEGYIYRMLPHGTSIYAVTSAGIRCSGDAGDTWHDRSGDFVASGGLTTFAPAANDNGVLLAEGRDADGQGVFRSTDEGVSWQRCSGLDNQEDFVAVQVHPTVRAAAYTVSQHHAYASDDKGETWERIEAPATETIDALAVAKI